MSRGKQEWLLALVFLVMLLVRHHVLVLLGLVFAAVFMCYKRPLRMNRAVLYFLLMFTMGASLIAPYDPMMRLEAGDILGLDALGRDQFSRLVLGNRNSVMIAAFGSLGAVLLGTLAGALLALGHPWLRLVLKFLVQVWLSIPLMLFFFLAIALLDGGSALTLVTLFTMTLWTEPARLLEQKISELERADFVQVARMGGLDERAVFMREILPNLKGVLTVNLLVSFISAVVLESSVGFLGLGLSLGTPSLGHLIEFGARNMDRQPLVLLASISLLMAWIFIMRSFLKQLGTNNRSLLVQ